MSEIAKIPGIQGLWEKTKGDSQVVVAVLDGVVDQAHPCFDGARLKRLPTLVQGEANPSGRMSSHGTHVASLILGQHGSPVQGIAPNCQGLVIPVFADEGRRLSQLDLSRAIEQAVNAGAHIINISGGQLTDYGEAEDWLQQAVRLCRDNNVLIVAAAGNDGCECLHVPAALPAVLAVGATDGQGQPLELSNWGQTYQNQGILAPGENILGAKPGGGTVRLSGTSFATPIISGVAALLLSLQRQRGEEPDPQKVRTALLKTALPCNLPENDQRPRCLVGEVNIAGAFTDLTGETMSESEELSTVEASGCGCDGTLETSPQSLLSAEGTSAVAPTEAQPAVAASSTETAVAPAQPTEVAVIASEPQSTQAPVTPTSVSTSSVSTSNHEISGMSNTTANAITPSQPVQASGGDIIYVIGTLGYDFGTEARRDSFKQLMPPYEIEGTQVPANPYDARQMVDYLEANLSEAKSLIWTLNMELTPIYALEPSGSFARDVYAAFQELLSGEVQAEDSEQYIERVSIPGRLTGRTVKLFSGQVVPVVEPVSPRGIYGWRVNTLVSSALEAVRGEQAEADDEQMRKSLSSFLNRVYYDLRNLGQTSQDRALNFAATNAFQAAQTFSEAVAAGMELDSIVVQRSPFCRMDSDCWDVQLKFFDPENNRRAKKVFRFTIDVSDLIPVTLGEVRSWSSPY
ncbi:MULTISPECIES: PatA/PatG family cyanobactin maturation protease [unclassified Moorena]|uniref:S8 family peptidase n=2 Tax=Moorena TaxID=1155738 RepID=UPI0014016D0B|nr:MULTISPECIES: PatA/PatG family cyanobactin maturation protease [unclassified Moorena]NEO14992.1 PatA/PatG family cyanobactin maturation protease [Moorena sp. SIO3E8]NEQ03445.1 PatA/PatG family cyanobactin maturation protease [Moorena sp. SIO3F7]